MDCAGKVRNLKLVALALLLAGGAAAQDRGNGIRGGMTPADVISVYGPPASKVFQESLRRQIWRYSGFDVEFKEGLVQGREPHLTRGVPEGRGQGTKPPGEGSRKQSRQSGFFARRGGSDPRRTAQVFREIMESIPSESEAGPAPGAPAAPRPMAAPFPEDE